jgi:hypothetical protein
MAKRQAVVVIGSRCSGASRSRIEVRPQRMISWGNLNTEILLYSLYTPWKIECKVHMASHCRTGLWLSVGSNQKSNRKMNISAYPQLLFITSETSLACPFGSGRFRQGGT